jgi:hypothetical protein
MDNCRAVSDLSPLTALVNLQTLDMQAHLVELRQLGNYQIVALARQQLVEREREALAELGGHRDVGRLEHLRGSDDECGSDDDGFYSRDVGRLEHQCACVRVCEWLRGCFRTVGGSFGGTPVRSKAALRGWFRVTRPPSRHCMHSGVQSVRVGVMMMELSSRV